MRTSKKGLIALPLLATALLMQPVLLCAFDLIELPVQINLAAEEEFSQLFDQQEFPYTGFTVSNPGQTPITLDGASALIPLGLLPGENVQDGFALLDSTLLLELSATNEAGGRADIRTTYRMDIGPRMLEPSYIESLLRSQGVVEQGRARARARAMGRADARVMRFVTEENGGTWVRAARAIRAQSRADIRFTPRMAPDGVLGHYGNYSDTSGNLYVWAVMDRNSKYAVGLTVDRDNDGVANADDNCVDLANSDQNNLDNDSNGDACDSDDDNDTVADANDNCPLASNEDQSDFDDDGYGDVCDADVDNDGVNEGVDQCTKTQLGAIVDNDGCSIDDRCPCENEWKNHGAYVRCVAHTSGAFVEGGLITEDDKDVIMSGAGQSACGHY